MSYLPPAAKASYSLWNQWYEDCVPEHICEGAQTEAECDRLWQKYKNTSITNGNYQWFLQQCCGAVYEEVCRGNGDGADGGIDLESGEFAEKVLSVIGDLWEGITDRLEAIVAKMGGWITDAISGIQDAFSGWVTMLERMLDRVKQWFANIWQAIEGVYDRVANWIASVYERVKDWLGDLVNNVWQWIQDIYERVREAIVSAYDLVKQAFQIAIEWVGEQLSRLWDAIKSAFSRFIEWLREGLAVVVKTVGNWLRPLWEAVTSIYERLKDWFGKTIQAVGEWIASVASEVWEAFQEFAVMLERILDNTMKRLIEYFIGNLEDTGGQMEDIMVGMAKTQIRVAQRIASEILDSGVGEAPDPGPYGIPGLGVSG